MKNRRFTILTAFAAVLLFAGISQAQLQRCTEAGSIKQVTKTRSGSHELVTFDVLTATPDYTVRNAKPPFSEYGEDKHIKIKGKAFKSIVFKGVNWTCKIGENFSTATSTVTAVKSIEQFEGQVEYIIGYSSRSKFVGTAITGKGNSRKITLKFRR